MKNKKGFTLVELLAVIVVLAIIMVIATPNVLNSVKESKLKARYTAAKEITEIAATYIETVTESDSDIKITEDNEKCVKVKTLVEKGYLEIDATNPNDENAENIAKAEDFDGQKVCTASGATNQDGYSPSNDGYSFDGYKYYFE